MKFFFDNNMAPSISRALHELSRSEGIEVRHLRDKFAPSIPDVEWLEQLSRERNWVVVSGDSSITRKPHERLAWQASGLTAFFLQKGRMGIRFWDQSWKLVKWWPTITETAKRFETGHAFLVPVNGNKLKAISVPR